MTPAQQLAQLDQLAIAIIGVAGACVTALLVLGLRALWKLAQILTEDRDATKANTVAIEALTERVDQLDGRGTTPPATTATRPRAPRR